MGYSRKTSNYLKRIALSDLTHVISMADHVAIGVETPRIDSGCSLEKVFSELICMNYLMILHQIGDQVDPYYICVRGPLT